jgi:adenylate cyclase
LWRPLSATGGIVLLLLAYVLVASLLFDAGLLVNMIYPPLAILLAFATTLVYRVGFEQAAQRRLRGVMARYLSPPVCHWVLQDPERLHLGGETRTMTVLFADLRGFTALAHSLEPQALVALLNAYMTAMTAIIFKHDGVLDKFIGDAIMAFWNAPMGQEDHARRACETALDMLARFHTLQAEWARRGWPRLDMGIGINTGPMVVGNMGSRDRLTYTVIGDTVNVASRLEGLTKEYGTRIVIGDSTRLAAGDGFLYRFLDRVVVQGRSAPLMVYELSGRAGQLDAAHAMLLERYTYGIELYQQRQWAEAVACFQALLAAAADDGPSALYLRRSQDFLKEGPPADWDGVYVAKMK